jgi:hypothetical protein
VLTPEWSDLLVFLLSHFSPTIQADNPSFIMPESSISPADRLPEPGTLLTRKILQDQRHKLLERLVAKEKLWDDEYNQYTKNSNPDQDQLASISAMSNAYRSFFPYADPSPRPLSYFDHTNQITAQDIVKKRHAVSQLSEADLKELDKYKSLAIFTQFATELADRGRPIKYTQESHDICGIYWGIYGMVS